MKRTTAQRLIITILAVAMLLTAVGCSGSSSRIIAEGRVDNLRWAIDENGELSFTGTGAIPGEEYILSMETGLSETVRPEWYNYRDQVTGVIIGGGIDSVSMNAFVGFSSLWTVDISATVRTIDGYAIYACPSLEQIIIRGGNVDMERYCIGYTGGTAESYLSSVVFYGTADSGVKQYAQQCGAKYSEL